MNIAVKIMCSIYVLMYSQTITAMVLRGLATLVAVTVLFVSYKISQEPVPIGCTEPTKVRFVGFLYKQIHQIATLFETLGIATDEAVKKYITSLPLYLPVDGVTFVDKSFEGIKVRIYTPTENKGKLPGMVYYHGGGWTVASIESHHTVTAFFAREVNMVVVSVEYRLAPKYTQLDGFEDCIIATKHLINNADKFNVDAERVVVAGDSAGGNFAAAISLYLRDQGFKPMPKIQLLIYPSVQGIAYDLPSMQQNTKGPFMDRYELMWFKSSVINGNRDLIPAFMANAHVPRSVRQKFAEGLLNIDQLPKELLYPPYKPPAFPEGDTKVWNKIKHRCFDPYQSPLMAKNHSNLPEAYIFTAMYDQLRDEGYMYANKLRASGVKVTHYNCPYGFHGMINFWQIIRDSKKANSEMASYLRDSL